MRRCTMIVCLLSCMVLSLSRPAVAQTPTYAQGTIKDEKGNALAGATVLEKDRPSNATSTDTAGHFVLLLKGRSGQVIISFVGFDDQTLKVTGSPLTVLLRQAKGNTSDVV